SGPGRGGRLRRARGEAGRAGAARVPDRAPGRTAGAARRVFLSPRHTAGSLTPTLKRPGGPTDAPTRGGVRELLKPTPAEGEAGLRAMAMVARAPGKIAAPAGALIAAAQKVLLDSAHDVDRLDEIAPADLARAIVRPEIRRQLVQGMIVVSLS